jgi:hypothetical protein
MTPRPGAGEGGAVPTRTSPPVAAARPIPALTAVAAALLAAFVVLPGRLAALAAPGYADERELTTALRRSFVGWWDSGQRALSPELAHVVDHWFRYHVAKATLAAILLGVLSLLAVRLWQAARGSRGPARAGLAAAVAAAAGLGLAALLAVMANLQGVVAPFGSMFPMLFGPPSGTVLDRAAAVLVSGGPRPPAVGVMLDAYVRYHAAMAVVASVVSLAAAAGAVVAWRQGLRLPAVAGALLMACTVVLAVANTGTTFDPEPGFLGLLRGGW